MKQSLVALAIITGDPSDRFAMKQSFAVVEPFVGGRSNGFAMRASPCDPCDWRTGLR